MVGRVMGPETGIQVDDLDVFGIEQIDDRDRGGDRQQHDGEGAAVVLGQVLPATDQLRENFLGFLPDIIGQLSTMGESLASFSHSTPIPQRFRDGRSFRGNGSCSFEYIKDQIGNMHPANERRPPGLPYCFVPDQGAVLV